jgi:hypothetical protein
MTKRLEEALKRLTPDQIEQLTILAEDLAPRPGGPQPGEPAQFNWIGCMQHAPERNGVDAAKRASEIRLELLNKSSTK